MSDDRRRAILAGGCFWGMQDLIRKQPGVVSTRVGYTGGDECRIRPTATIRGHAEAIEIVFDPAQTDYRALLEFFFQIHDPTHEEPAGQRRRHQLPLGDLLPRRRAEAGRAGHHRRRRRLRAVAGQGGHRGDPGRRRSGRPSPSTRTTWSATPTATPATSRGRAGSCPSAPRSNGFAECAVGTRHAVGVPERTLAVAASAAVHHHAAALLRGVRHPAEVTLLPRCVGRLDGEVPQHRSQHDVHLHVGERRTDAAPGAAAEGNPGERVGLGVDEALRVEPLRIGEDRPGSRAAAIRLTMIE